MTPRAAIRAAATAATLRRAALALLLAATLLAGGMLAGPGTSSADGAALTVSSIAVTSTAGSDNEYHAGEDIVIRVTFSQNIASYTGAALTITLDSGTVTANPPALASGGTVATVDYTYTVTDADNDADGITVTTGALAGTYVHAGHSTTPDHTSFILPTMTYGSSLTQSNHKVNVTVTNYDSDGDGLIEIENLHQLNAIRYDLDGNGQPAAASISNYAAAFPARSQAHGCPDTAADADTDPGPCLGYELIADLDFDTNGDGSVNASDAYPNWTPIGDDATSYSANFNGNGHTIANLTINSTFTSTSSTYIVVGLFGRVRSGSSVIENVGLTDVNITAIRPDGSTTTLFSIGGLAGLLTGTVRTSYATGTITVTAGNTYIITSAGGLIGQVGRPTGDVVASGQLDASWAAVNVSVTSTSTAGTDPDSAGGLVGWLTSRSSAPSSVSTSYARGGQPSSGRTGSMVGGLIGRVEGPRTTVTASYWDTTTSNIADDTNSAAPEGLATTALQTPTGYTGIYEDWNIDVDGDATTGDANGKDDPWDFGTSSQYPVLKYASHDFAAQGRPFDYDADNDGLIDITTLAQLDAIRHDLNGDGDPAGAAGIAAFRKAFPHRVRSVAGRMGCQPTDHDSMPSTPDRATCTGYELLNNLDFDTNGDGSVGSGDEYSNWTPIANDDNNPYIATFRGNGHSINNLRSIHYGGTYIGLFGVLGTRGNGVPQKGRIDTLAVTNANVLGWQGVGILVGMNSGHIVGSYVTGSVTGTSDDIGGLTGFTHHPYHQDRARIIASYSTATVTSPGRSGGLVGLHSNGPIIASYAAGKVTSTSNSGGLNASGMGTAYWVGTYANSYWDKDVTTKNNSYNSSQTGVTTGNVGTSVSSTTGATTTGDLKSPTDYTGIYATWDDHDLDGDGSPDDAWDFGTDSEYPVLAYGGHNLAAQGRTVVDYDDDNDGLIDIRTLAQLDAIRHDLNGDGDIAAANAPAYRVAFPNRDRSAAGRMGCPLTDHDNDADTPDQATCTGYELRNDLDFDTDRDGSTHTGGTGDMGDDYYNGGAGWDPIGATSTSASHTATFSGTFRGNGHTIDNLFINRALNNTHVIGMFGRTDAKGRIETLGVTNAYVGTHAFIGILVGSNSGTIIGCYVTGSVKSRTLSSGGMVGINNGHFPTSGPSVGAIIASYSTADVELTMTSSANRGILAGLSYVGSIQYSYGAGRTYGSGNAGQLIGQVITAGGTPATEITDSYWDRQTTGTTGGKTTVELQTPAGYTGIYQNWNRNLDDDTATGDNQGRDDPWDIRLGHYPVLKYGNFDVDEQRPLQATAGADVPVYSGQTVTVEGSGRALGGATLGATPYRWTVSDPDGLDPAALTLSGAETARLTFTAPTGLTEDQALVFRLTVTGTVGGRTATVFDEVTVNVVAVRPNQLLSLSLTDSEDDAVSLAPPFVSLTYDYNASVANQIGSVTVTPRVLSGSTMTLNGQAVASGAEVEVPLKYRGNEIVIVVTPPEPEPSETMDGETADGEATDETVEETTCEQENDGIKPCTYTVTVRRAVPPRLASVPRSLTIDEGGTGTYTVELDTRILTGAVTIAIASDNPAVTVSPTEVTLKPLDMTPRTITVTAASDDDRDDENVVITHTANGAHYYDVIATVGVTVTDTTAPPPAPDPALSVSATALRLAEGGSGAYTVALATRPDDNVTVTIASNNPDVTTRPASLTFTTSNWATAQRVTVSAASDGDTANDTATLTHTASGGGYGDAPAALVTVSVTDDDTAGLAITPTVLNLIENGISAYIVSLTAQPSGNVTVSIASDNPDVTVRLASLTFTTANWATPQAVLVITRADAGGGDELATLRMTAQGGGYAGQTGQVLASVDDTLVPLAVNADAPAGVSVYGPPGTTARATVSPPAADTPTVATGAGFSIGNAVAVAVSDAPDDGLEICLPVSGELRAEAGSALILTLLRYAAGSWTELAGARDLGDRVCASGVTGQAAYAAAYALRPGTVLDLAASVGDDPGTIALSWTPPAAGASQVAVVVNIADDTDYCLDTLPGLDASSYTCAGRTAGQTYVALLIVLLPDGGYTLANIVRFELPAPASQ